MNAKPQFCAALLPFAFAASALAAEPASLVVDCGPSTPDLGYRQVAHLIGDRHFPAVRDARAVINAEIRRVCRHGNTSQVLVMGEQPVDTTRTVAVSSPRR